MDDDNISETTETEVQRMIENGSPSSRAGTIIVRMRGDSASSRMTGTTEIAKISDDASDS